MITLKKSNNVFYNRKVILNYFFTNEFIPNSELEKIDWLELRITGKDNDEIFRKFLENFISKLKDKFYIDFISYQRSDEVKNRIRTYAKYFYDLRKQDFLSDKYIAEKEIETKENRSFFCGILQVDDVDNEIIFEELLNSYNRIIHAETKEENQLIDKRLDNLLNKIDISLFRNKSLIDINYLVLLERFLNKNSLIISYMYDGGDDLIFTVYSGKKVSNNLEQLIVESIPSSQKVNKVIATSDEVNELIESYFNEWRGIKINK